MRREIRKGVAVGLLVALLTNLAQYAWSEVQRRALALWTDRYIAGVAAQQQSVIKNRENSR